MRNDKYYYSALKSVHIWSIVCVTSLNHLLRKFYEYFCYFLCMQYFALSFYSMVWSVAALDFAAILSASFIVPFIIDKSPHFVQFCCQIFIGMTTLMMVWLHSIYGLFLLRFVFGIGYNILLSNWSMCISTFVSPSKQSSAIGRIDLSWSFASFFFILCAYIMDNYGLKYIFYILAICAMICSFLLFSIMPSQKLIRTEIDRHNFCSSLLAMFKLIFFSHFPTAIFLIVIGIITFVNSALTLLLAPWLCTNYSLSITEFGYCTVIIGTAQVVAIIFSYQFGHKLGVGWSLVAGILVQSLMFVLIFLLNSESGYFYAYIAANQSSTHYTFPLLFILLILAIHFIAAEFTYINAVSCMLHIAPLHIVSNKTIAANSMRFVTCVCRIFGAIFAPYLWYYNDENNNDNAAIGSFEFFSFLGAVLLGIAFFMHLGLMMYIACCVWDKKNELNEEYMMSSLGDKSSYCYSDCSQSVDAQSYLFQNDADYPNVKKRDDEEMDETYIAKILSTNIDFAIH